MGRYYSGDIDGKFWFGIQESDDADFFGYEGQYLYWDDEEEDDSEPYALSYYFEEEDLDEINEGIRLCQEHIGEYKERFDTFFQENDTYTPELLSESTGCKLDGIEDMLKYYARLELGIKIKKCVEDTGVCSFDAYLS